MPNPTDHHDAPLNDAATISSSAPAAGKKDVILAWLAGFFLVVSVFAMSPYAQVFICLYGSLFAYGPSQSASPALRRVGTVLLVACLSMAIAWALLSRLLHEFPRAAPAM